MEIKVTSGSMVWFCSIRTGIYAAFASTLVGPHTAYMGRFSFYIHFGRDKKKKSFLFVRQKNIVKVKNSE